MTATAKRPVPTQRRTPRRQHPHSSEAPLWSRWWATLLLVLFLFQPLTDTSYLDESRASRVEGFNVNVTSTDLQDNQHTTKSISAFQPFSVSAFFDAPPVPFTLNLAPALAWRGKYADPTGLIYLGARYYEPNSGRFLSPDPAGHAASMDLYSYASGDPVNFVDPDGRFGKEALGFNSGNDSLGSLLGRSLANSSASNLNIIGQTYNDFQGNLSIFDGNVFQAGNATLNPAFRAGRGFTEFGTGLGLSPSNFANDLSNLERGFSFLEGSVATVETVGVGFGGAGLTSRLGFSGSVRTNNFPMGPGAANIDEFASGLGGKLPRVTLQPGQTKIGFMSSDGRLIGNLESPGKFMSHSTLAELLGLSAGSGNLKPGVTAVTVGKRTTGQIDSFGSGSFGPLDEAQKALARQLVE